ncbi:MAG: enoyl-CoA hydratase/isomerase family protein [Candidatus Heimdallarchaeota archaeon]|nr:enoyl-CoA hydratase/isomerase family protein [Candidatus Heimdallarchaeota archaeon]
MQDIIATKDYDRGILVLEMNAKVNTFTQELLTSLEMWLDHAIIDKQLHSVILTGKSSIFNVGGDIKQWKIDLESGSPEAYIERTVPKINSIIKKIITHPLIIIAAVNGSAAGGGLSLALSCDYVIAAPEAKFAFAFSSLDLTPDSGSTLSFVRSFGYSRALSALLTSEVMTANEAYNLGAINQLSNSENLLPDAIEFASKMHSVSKETIANTKSLLNSSVIQILDNQLKMEYDAIHFASKSTNFSKKLDIVLGRKNK